ncbi:hypothetical protein EDD18DRAFT_1196334 [Armillaria luteobubalina]|uniref:Secreted protein n=1 Tax=Armillaria luteobubalina TaxID=153913 RepID=A0AA39PLK7_9AGAR|nr:hypothetical protein EDD18DRAFT_1196334 [Armillaria luteobubalina]
MTSLHRRLSHTVPSACIVLLPLIPSARTTWQSRTQFRWYKTNVQKALILRSDSGTSTYAMPNPALLFLPLNQPEICR